MNVDQEKLKEYGKEAYQPFIQIAYKYQDQFIPYFEALVKGLDGAKKSLGHTNASEEETYLAGYFEDAAIGIRNVLNKLQEKDFDSFNQFIKNQVELRPGLAFSTSYLAGLILGRLGKKLSTTNPVEPPSFDQPIQ